MKDHLVLLVNAIFLPIIMWTGCGDLVHGSPLQIHKTVDGAMRENRKWKIEKPLNFLCAVSWSINNFSSLRRNRLEFKATERA